MFCWNLVLVQYYGTARGGQGKTMEYYGGIESINVRPRGQPQVHQLFAGGDWQARPAFSVNLGIGFDIGSRGPGVVPKSRLEWDWRTHQKALNQKPGTETWQISRSSRALELTSCFWFYGVTDAEKIGGNAKSEPPTNGTSPPAGGFARS